MRDAPALHRHNKSVAANTMLDGTLLGFTTVRHPPAGFGSEPYTVGLIERSDGTRTCAQLITTHPPKIGAAVSPRLRRTRTLENGLFVHDIKYEVVAQKPVEQMHIQSYVIALTGPSGVGKTTITRTLMSLFSSYAEQVPIYTTREPKKKETEPYRYVSTEEFMRMKKSGEIIADTKMASDSEKRQYGYAKKDIEELWNQGKIPLVVTDINLLKGLSKSLGRRAILSCGLLPPGNSRRRMLSSLVHRLRARGRDTEQQIKERLKVAEIDLAAFDTHPQLFDHMVVNDELDTCVNMIKKLVPVPQESTRA